MRSTYVFLIRAAALAAIALPLWRLFAEGKPVSLWWTLSVVGLVAGLAIMRLAPRRFILGFGLIGFVLVAGLARTTFSALGKVQTSMGWPAVIGLFAVIAGGLWLWWKRRMDGLWGCAAKRTEAKSAMEVADFGRAERLLRESLEEAIAFQGDGARGNLGMTHYELALLLIQLERKDEAIEHLRKSLAAVEEDASPYGRNLKRCVPEALRNLLELGERWDELAGELRGEMARTNDPMRQAELQAELVYVYRAAGRLEEALEALRSSAAILESKEPNGSNFAHATWGIARTLAELGDHRAAVAEFRKLGQIAERMPEQPERGDFDEDDEDAEEPRIVWELRSLDGLGLALAKAGEHEEAVEVLERADMLSATFDGAANEGDASRRLAMAESLLQLGRFEEARAQAKSAQRIAKDPTNVETGETLLDRIEAGSRTP
jgi:LPXTG-motif cell wall-anchored protein